jgi:catechol 2,3-dioxygenase-like lactoylglutathione lyase family enzyme
VAVELNHTIVAAKDKHESATFLAEVLGLPSPVPFGHFLAVQLAHGLTFDFATSAEVTPQHYAFLVGDDEFDQVFDRIKERHVPYWADPGRRRPSQINTNHGGRGVYFTDPSGHFLEILTRPYGSV